MACATVTFVENSFKHGAIKNGRLNIDVNVYSEENNVIFNIKNSNSDTNSEGKGIGLENIKKRLNLLYENNYTIDIKNSDALFEVNLKLNTN